MPFGLPSFLKPRANKEPMIQYFAFTEPPTEMVMTILFLLDRKDLESLRLVCKFTNAAISHGTQFIGQIYTDLSLQSLQSHEEMAKNVQRSRLVHTLVIKPRLKGGSTLGNKIKWERRDDKVLDPKQQAFEMSANILRGFPNCTNFVIKYARRPSMSANKNFTASDAFFMFITVLMQAGIQPTSLSLEYAYSDAYWLANDILPRWVDDTVLEDPRSIPVWSSLQCFRIDEAPYGWTTLPAVLILVGLMKNLQKLEINGGEPGNGPSIMMTICKLRASFELREFSLWNDSTYGADLLTFLSTHSRTLQSLTLRKLRVSNLRNMDLLSFVKALQGRLPVLRTLNLAEWRTRLPDTPGQPTTDRYLHFPDAEGNTHGIQCQYVKMRPIHAPSFSAAHRQPPVLQIHHLLLNLPPSNHKTSKMATYGYMKDTALRTDIDLQANIQVMKHMQQDIVLYVEPRLSVTSNPQLGPFERLPAELVEAIAILLSPTDFASLRGSCRYVNTCLLSHYERHYLSTIRTDLSIESLHSLEPLSRNPERQLKVKTLVVRRLEPRCCPVTGFWAMQKRHYLDIEDCIGKWSEVLQPWMNCTSFEIRNQYSTQKKYDLPNPNEEIDMFVYLINIIDHAKKEPLSMSFNFADPAEFLDLCRIYRPGSDFHTLWANLQSLTMVNVSPHCGFCHYTYEYHEFVTLAPNLQKLTIGSTKQCKIWGKLVEQLGIIGRLPCQLKELYILFEGFTPARLLAALESSRATLHTLDVRNARLWEPQLSLLLQGLTDFPALKSLALNEISHRGLSNLEAFKPFYFRGPLEPGYTGLSFYNTAGQEVFSGPISGFIHSGHPSTMRAILRELIACVQFYGSEREGGVDVDVQMACFPSCE
ncbi:hypothetical protein BJX99DRAFT_264361 [Aspergillus californicus]